MNPFSQNPVLDVTTTDTTKASFDASATPVLMEALYALYTDPLSAVARELICNATDSHVQAGVVEPVRVQVTAEVDPDTGKSSSVLVVTDKGLGLDREGLISTFSSYGGSSKRGQDRDCTVGGFGLGAKSAHALTPTFSAEGIRDGRRTVAVMSLSPDGVSQVSILVNGVPTHERNGVTVRVPLRQSAPDVEEAVRRLVRWMPTGTVVLGEDESNECVLDGGARVTDTVTLCREVEGACVVMGGVCYPLTARQRVRLAEALMQQRKLASRGARHLVLTLPLGAARPGPARESLRDELATDAALEKACEGLGEALESLVNGMDDPVPLLAVTPLTLTWRGIDTNTGFGATTVSVISSGRGSSAVLRSNNLNYSAAKRSRHDMVADNALLYPTANADTSTWAAVVTDGTVEQVKYVRNNAVHATCGHLTPHVKTFALVTQPSGHLGWLTYGTDEDRIPRTLTFEQFRSAVAAGRPTRSATAPVVRVFVPGYSESQWMTASEIKSNLSGTIHVVMEGYPRYRGDLPQEMADFLGEPIVAAGSTKPSVSRFAGVRSKVEPKVFDSSALQAQVHATIPQEFLGGSALADRFLTVRADSILADEVLDPQVRAILGTRGPDPSALSALQRWALEGAPKGDAIPARYRHLPKREDVSAHKLVELANGLYLLDQYRQAQAATTVPDTKQNEEAA